MIIQFNLIAPPPPSQISILTSLTAHHNTRLHVSACHCFCLRRRVQIARLTYPTPVSSLQPPLAVPMTCRHRQSLHSLPPPFIALFHNNKLMIVSATTGT